MRASAENKVKFPLALKLVYSAFVVMHVIFNWRVYGPLNFLWECDVAVLTIWIALWLDSRFLTSMVALAALVPMGLWIVDLGARVALGHYIFGFAGYMFDRRLPQVIRMISAFHIWLPPLLFWMVMRIGYDRRALWAQTIFMAALLTVSRLVSEPPPEQSVHEPVNINWVYGTSDKAAQTKLPAAGYVGLMIALYPLLIYVPTHLGLSLICDCEWGKRRFLPRTDGLPTLSAAV